MLGSNPADLDDAEEDMMFANLLQTHLVSREANQSARSRSSSPQQRLSRREREQERARLDRVARGLADFAPPNPQAPWRSVPRPPAASDRPRNAAQLKASQTPAATVDPPLANDAAASSRSHLGAQLQPWLDLSALAAAGKNVPGSKSHESELRSLAASVAAAAANLRAEDLVARGLMATRPTPVARPTAAGDEGGRQLVGFKVKAASRTLKARPGASIAEDDGGAGGSSAPELVAAPAPADAAPAAAAATTDADAARAARAAAAVSVADAKLPLTRSRHSRFGPKVVDEDDHAVGDLARRTVPACSAVPPSDPSAVAELQQTAPSAAAGAAPGAAAGSVDAPRSDPSVVAEPQQTAPSSSVAVAAPGAAASEGADASPSEPSVDESRRRWEQELRERALAKLLQKKWQSS